MLDDLTKKLVLLKQDFAKNYTGNAHIQEIIPLTDSLSLIDENHLQKLHDFCTKKPNLF